MSMEPNGTRSQNSICIYQHSWDNRKNPKWQFCHLLINNFTLGIFYQLNSYSSVLIFPIPKQKGCILTKMIKVSDLLFFLLSRPTENALHHVDSLPEVSVYAFLYNLVLSLSLVLIFLA